MTIEIKNRNTGAVIFTFSGKHLRGAGLREAALAGAALCGADLSAADLRGADLRGANLRGANLRAANLRGAALAEADLAEADLRGADLRGADLRGADLAEANLSGADLSDADLSGASLSGADLSGADLSGADLAGADLVGADLRDVDMHGAGLTTFKQNLWLILSQNPEEVDGLIKALQEGRVDGSCYTGECACLIGTIANVRGCAVEDVRGGIDLARPAEQWFLGIKQGDTPDTNSVVKITLEWIAEWQSATA